MSRVDHDTITASLLQICCGSAHSLIMDQYDHRYDDDSSSSSIASSCPRPAINASTLAKIIKSLVT